MGGVVPNTNSPCARGQLALAVGAWHSAQPVERPLGTNMTLELAKVTAKVTPHTPSWARSSFPAFRGWRQRKDVFWCGRIVGPK